MIPSFAVGRTQELLYFLRQIKADGLISGHDGFEVYVDSPLAVESTEIFQDNRRDYFDQEALELLNRGINPIQFPGLRVSLTSEESKAINEDQRCKVILSASGMCEAGRIKHHLKHNLWRPECTVLFVGYQGAGTLGRALVEGASKVRLFGEEIEVRAQIRRLAGVSGHADNNGLLEWISNFDPRPERVFVTHGDDSVCDLFAGRLREELHLDSFAPYPGAQFDLAGNQLLYEGSRQKIHKDRASKPKGSPVYLRLLSAGRRLMELIQRSQGRANKDMAKLTDQINAMCDKWE